MPDQRTLNVYADRAEELAATYEGVRPPFLARVCEAAPERGRLLDIGCGSGRDLAAFALEGFDVHGVEPVAQMRAFAVLRHPELAGRIVAGSLPDAIPFDDGSFAVVHAAAVLMHLPREELFNAIFTIRGLLQPGGIVHFSYDANRPGVGADQRVDDGRLYQTLIPDHLRALLGRAGFRIVSEKEKRDSLGRAGMSWISVIARRVDEGAELPLQRIGEIVYRDDKVATYKLALLRALADLATTRFHEAVWDGAGRVRIHADLVVDLWIRYYWPLVESARYVAQKDGEAPGCRKPIAFRAELEQLVAGFRRSGSYAHYTEQREIDPKVDRVLRQKVRNALREGPVRYASGGIFRWEGGWISMPGKFWEDLGEFGHWVEPAVRLQWAEETERFSKGEVSVGEALGLLSTDYRAERNVGAARDLFGKLPRLDCTWTGVKLRHFDVDHILPFSLWRDNGLWNLVPASPAVNRAKGNSLVARDILLARRDAVVHAWELQRAALPRRFDLDLRQLLGAPPDPGNWQAPAFHRLAEAIESTALRRQAARWRP